MVEDIRVPELTTIHNNQTLQAITALTNTAKRLNKQHDLDTVINALTQPPRATQLFPDRNRK